MTWQESSVGVKDLEVTSKELDQAWLDPKAWKLIGPVEDKRFGKVQLFENTKDSQERIIQLEFAVNGESEAKRILCKCKMRTALNSEFIQNLVGFECRTKKSLCSRQYIVHMYFEQPDMDLEQKETQLKSKVQWFSA